MKQTIKDEMWLEQNRDAELFDLTNSKKNALAHKLDKIKSQKSKELADRTSKQKFDLMARALQVAELNGDKASNYL